MQIRGSEALSPSVPQYPVSHPIALLQQPCPWHSPGGRCAAHNAGDGATLQPPPTPHLLFLFCTPEFHMGLFLRGLSALLRGALLFLWHINTCSPWDVKYTQL